MSAISKTLRDQVIKEAKYRCEYCQSLSKLTGIPLVIDHIIPVSLGGSNQRDNLAASCYRCNEFKGAKSNGIDPETGKVVLLFNPRQQVWNEHFSWLNGGTHIIGKTRIGRATVIALRLNNDNLVEARNIWISVNWHPPIDS